MLTALGCILLVLIGVGAFVAIVLSPRDVHYRRVTDRKWYLISPEEEAERQAAEARRQAEWDRQAAERRKEWTVIEEELRDNDIQVENTGDITDYCWKTIPLVRCRVNNWDYYYGMPQICDVIYPYSEWRRGDDHEAARLAIAIRKRLIPLVGQDGERLAEFAAALSGSYDRDR